MQIIWLASGRAHYAEKKGLEKFLHDPFFCLCGRPVPNGSCYLIQKHIDFGWSVGKGAEDGRRDKAKIRNLKAVETVIR